jgi:hypothetical protein
VIIGFSAFFYSLASEGVDRARAGAAAAGLEAAWGSKSPVLKIFFVMLELL